MTEARDAMKEGSHLKKDRRDSMQTGRKSAQ
jgi:hypothetical protein